MNRLGTSHFDAIRRSTHGSTSTQADSSHISDLASTPDAYESEMWELLIRQIVEWLDNTQVCPACKGIPLAESCTRCDGVGRMHI